MAATLCNKKKKKRYMNVFEVKNKKKQNSENYVAVLTKYVYKSKHT